MDRVPNWFGFRFVGNLYGCSLGLPRRFRMYQTIFVILSTWKSGDEKNAALRTKWVDLTIIDGFILESSIT